MSRNSDPWATIELKKSLRNNNNTKKLKNAMKSLGREINNMVKKRSNLEKKVNQAKQNITKQKNSMRNIRTILRRKKIREVINKLEEFKNQGEIELGMMNIQIGQRRHMLDKLAAEEAKGETKMSNYELNAFFETMGGSKKKRTKRKTTKKKTMKPKVHKGPRGGKYIMKKGKKVYI